jgi:hypothetical protein
VREKKENVRSAIAEHNSKTIDSDFEEPTNEEIEMFSRICKEVIGDLSFKAKRGIILKVLDEVVGNQKQLEVNGYLPVHEAKYVKFNSKGRNSRFTKCR